jgi:hypothetical protein
LLNMAKRIFNICFTTETQSARRKVFFCPPGERLKSSVFSVSRAKRVVHFFITTVELN